MHQRRIHAHNNNRNDFNPWGKTVARENYNHSACNCLYCWIVNIVNLESMSSVINLMGKQISESSYHLQGRIQKNIGMKFVRSCPHQKKRNRVVEIIQVKISLPI